ncbi:ComEC/Rec2 family competence protein [Labilibaculum sp. K2S]|uniref:ComEC/Rec2 family competence protein n=1 Tax=Labilibaculum sp. K2S TaxID=3056386 RepID=UPI0025A44192|nr:ComEC/Rec2 family competence protein [Labilibaculum sp. K2S]MDM8159356.1 ComEC/Rec2 family competence protein [Labilibaculum sp. K2S]
MTFRELLRQNPFLRLLLPVIIGISLSDIINIPQVTGWFLVLFGMFGVVLFVVIPKLRKSYSLRSLFGFFVFALCFGFGNIRYNDIQSRMYLPISKSKIILKGRVLDTPTEKGRSYAFVFDVQNIKVSDKWQKVSGKTMIYLQKDTKVKELGVGDLLVMKTELQRVKNAGNPHEFDYASYLKTQHILYAAYTDSLSWKQIGRGADFSIKVLASKWRDHLLSIYRKNGIQNESFDILAALTLGYKTGMDPEIKRTWADAGAMHVLAVSGLHVGIIYMIMSYLLRFLARFKYGGYLRGILLLLTLWTYALLTGMSPSVMRSATMFSFIVLGEMLKRSGSIYNSLAISAFFLLLIDPFLLFTVGFQFSYLAVVSIVFFQPQFDKLLYIGNPILKKLWQLTTVSLAAQIGTFPLAIYYFHQFPSYFLLSGYVVIIMAGILIYLSALLLLLSPIKILSESLGWILRNLVEGMNFLIVKIQALPGSVIRELSLSQYQLIFTYFLLFSMISLLSFKRKKAVYAFVIILIGIQLPNTIRIFQVPKKEILVFNSSGHSVVGFVKGNQGLFLVDKRITPEISDRIIQPFVLKENISEINFDTLRPIDIKLMGKDVVAIIGKRDNDLEKILKFIQPDYIVLRLGGLQSKKMITKEFPNCKMILDASIYRGDRKKYFSKENEGETNLFDVQEDGAYFCALSTVN